MSKKVASQIFQYTSPITVANIQIFATIMMIVITVVGRFITII